MGRRQTGTTKSGKFMNPADQARKEQRKRELKKNKKSRIAVRAAVLKAKDPSSLILEMEQCDAMEYDPEPSEQNLSARVLQEKRSKLKGTFIRVMKMYEKDEPEQFMELKKKMAEYEKRRNLMEQHFNAIKFASEANPEEIPLPSADGPQPSFDFAAAPVLYNLAPSEIPLPHVSAGPSKPILKKRPAQHKAHKARREPPGPPPGAPPELSDSDDEHEIDDTDESRATRVRFSGETEGDGDSRTRYKELAKSAGADAGEDLASGPTKPEGVPSISPVVLRAPPSMLAQRLMHVPAPPSGLPPGLRPQMPGIPPPPLRAPPGLPGFPPRMQRGMGPGIPGGAVLSGLPTATRRSDGAKDKPTATIEAKPQLRNMTAEITRLVPTQVKIRAGAKPAKSKSNPVAPPVPTPATHNFSNPNVQPQQKTKDDAYEQFMKEMTGLI